MPDDDKFASNEFYQHKLEIRTHRLEKRTQQKNRDMESEVEQRKTENGKRKLKLNRNSVVDSSYQLNFGENLQNICYSWVLVGIFREEQKIPKTIKNKSRKSLISILEQHTCPQKWPLD